MAPKEVQNCFFCLQTRKWGLTKMVGWQEKPAIDKEGTLFPRTPQESTQHQLDQRCPTQFPRTHPASLLLCLPSAPLPQASDRRQRGQRNSHQRPRTHGKEIRALGTLLPGGSEASPTAWLLSRVRVWGVLPLASSYVKCQTAGGQPELSWPSGPHLGHVCAHTNWGEGAAKKSLSVSSVRVTAKL